VSFATGKLRSDRDVARELGEAMAGVRPYVVMAFFAAQFVEHFRWSGLGEMTRSPIPSRR
jgi:aminobenzoyl-glutamate transport protein